MVTPHLSITEPPSTLNFESLQKKVTFDHANDIHFSRGGVYNPDAVDDLISWLEGNRCQGVVVHQLADQVGNLNPGQYITPMLMFPSYTLPGDTWHKFILGKIWGAIHRLGKVFSMMFGLFIVGQLVWYLIKVVMNCGYIHSAHCCSPKLAWSFCTEVLFTHHYRKTQRRQRPTVLSGRSDNDPSEHPRKRKGAVPESIKNVFSRGYLDDLQPSDSYDERRNTATAQASRAEIAEILNNSVRRQAERLASAHRVRANDDVLGRTDRSPPPYVTPPSSCLVLSDVTVHPNAPRISPLRNIEAECERATFRPDLTGQTFGRVEYTRVPTSDRWEYLGRSQKSDIKRGPLY